MIDPTVHVARIQAASGVLTSDNILRDPEAKGLVEAARNFLTAELGGKSALSAPPK